MQPPEHVGYWLSRAFRAVSAAAAEALRVECARLGQPFVVSPPQWGVLTTLAANGAQTVSALGQLMAVETPAITGVVTRLEQHGLVARAHDEADRRVVNVSLTSAGRRLVRALNPVMARVNAHLLPANQASELMAHLHDLIRRAANLAPVPSSPALALPAAPSSETPEES